MLRFWDNDVLQQTDGVLETIRQALLAPLPDPPPEGEAHPTTTIPPQREEGLLSALHHPTAIHILRPIGITGTPSPTLPLN